MIKYSEEIKADHIKRILAARKRRRKKRRTAYDLDYFESGGKERRVATRERRRKENKG